MTDDTPSQAPATSRGGPPAAPQLTSGRSDIPSSARFLLLAAVLVLAGGSLAVLVVGTTPLPGLPPFLVQGEAELQGWSVSRLLPLVLGAAGGLGALGLAQARQRAAIRWWLAVLATTWSLVWLAWNFVPDIASSLITGFLLLTNCSAVGGTRRIFRRRALSGASTRRDRNRRDPADVTATKRPADVLSGVVLVLLSVALAAPAVAPRIVAPPPGTVKTIAIAAPPEVDNATIVADQETSRVVVLLRSNYIQAFDNRVLQGTVVTLDSRRGTPLQTLPLDLYPGTLAVDGRVGHAYINAVAEFSYDKALNTVHVLDMRTGKLLYMLTFGHYLIDIAVDKQSGHLFAADWDTDMVHVLDDRTGALRRTIRVGKNPGQIVVAAGTQRVFVFSHGDDTHPALLSLLQATTGTLVRSMPWDAGQSTLAFAVDDRTGRVFGTTGDIVRVWDAQRGVELRHSIIPGGTSSALAVSAGTNRLFVVNSNHQSVSLLDARTGRVLRTVGVGAQPSALAVDERSQRVFVANTGSNSVSVLNALTGQALCTLAVGLAPIALGVDARRGHVFVYNAASGTVSILDAHTGAPHS